jgi:hypothetical protein
MITNEQMKPNRYGRWAQSRRLMAKIEDTFAKDGVVTVATAYHAWHYDKRHADMFRGLKDEKGTARQGVGLYFTVRVQVHSLREHLSR